jgi:hypothetical protein
MSKKPIPINERKVKLSITIDRLLNNEMELNTNNKSKYIEDLIKKDLLNKNG